MRKKIKLLWERIKTELEEIFTIKDNIPKKGKKKAK